MVGARLLYPGGLPAACRRCLPAAHPAVLTMSTGTGRATTRRPWKQRRSWGLLGALMLVEKGFWDKLGGMDEQFFLSWEDVDFSLRAWAAGRRVLYTGQAYAVHPEGTTRANRKAASLGFLAQDGQETKAGSGGNGGRFFTSGWPDPEAGGKIRFSRLQSAHWCKVLRKKK